MDIRVTFPGGKRVDAAFGNHVLHTDQPVSAGGEDSAPGPFDLFLASLGTCAGIFVLGFCQARGIPTDGIEVRQRSENNAEGKLAKVELDVVLPPEFPEKYRAAVLRAAENCKVKKVLAAPPDIVVQAVSPVSSSAEPPAGAQPPSGAPASASGAGAGSGCHACAAQ